VQLKDGCLRFIIASPDVLGAVMKTDGFKDLVASCPLVMKEILDKMAGVISSDKVVVSAETS
jgi:speckle-type POZ protein